MAARIAKHVTLVANTATTVTLTDISNRELEVVNVDGAAAVYIRSDGTAPTVAGDDCIVLPGAIGTVRVRGQVSGRNLVVKLISAGTPKVAVQVLE